MGSQKVLHFWLKVFRKRKFRFEFRIGFWFGLLIYGRFLIRGFDTFRFRFGVSVFAGWGYFKKCNTSCYNTFWEATLYYTVMEVLDAIHGICEGILWDQSEASISVSLSKESHHPTYPRNSMYRVQHFHNGIICNVGSIYLNMFPLYFCSSSGHLTSPFSISFPFS